MIFALRQARLAVAVGQVQGAKIPPKPTFFSFYPAFRFASYGVTNIPLLTELYNLLPRVQTAGNDIASLRGF